MENIINLYFVRHAESIGNIEKRLCGSTNFSLSERGYLQAEKVAQALSGINFDHIYTSPMDRTMITAKTILKKQENNNIPLTIIDEFKEMHFGDLDGMLHSLAKEKYPKEHYNWTHALRYPEGFPSQESVENCQKRFILGINNILNKTNSDSNILIATHGTVLRFFIGYLLGYEKNEFFKIPSSKNTAITKVEYNTSTNKFKIIYIANSDHLD